MESSFAIKQAVDKIARRINTIEHMNEWGEQTYAQNEQTFLQIVKSKANSKSETDDGNRFNFNKLTDLFASLTPSELELEYVAMAEMLDNVLGTNDVLPIMVNEKNKPAPSDDVYQIYQLIKSLTGIKTFYNETSKPFVIKYLKRFRYKPNFLNEFKNLIPEEEFKYINSDYDFNFVLYAQKVYEYYYEFYCRSDDINVEMLSEIGSMRNYDKIEYILNKVISLKNNSLKFEFDVNFAKPTEHNKEELEIFCNDVAIFIMNTHKIKHFDAPYHILSDYIRDSAGKLKSFKKLFSVWDRVLKVYDLKKRLSWQQIKSKYKIRDPEGDYDTAKMLIKSALNGTFPQI